MKNEETKKSDNRFFTHIFLQKKQRLIFTIAIVILIVSTVAGISYIKNSNYYLYRLIDNGKVEKIVDLYNGFYSNSTKKEEEFVNKIDSFAQLKYDEYISDTISYSQVMQKYNTIETVFTKIFIENFDISQYKTLVEIAKEQKEKYQQGILYLEKKEYSEAIVIFREILKEAKHYPNAAEKLAEAENGYRQYILNEAELKSSNKLYKEAIKILRTGKIYLPDDKSISNRLSDIENMVVQTAISDAKRDFTDSGYETSIFDIQVAIDTVGSNNELNKALEMYKEYIPVNIYDMAPTEKSNREAIQHSEVGTDNQGGSHKYILYSMHHSHDHKSEWATYTLNGKYDTLTFEVYRNSKSHNLHPNETDVINIYGNDNVLKSITVDKDFAPQSFTLDITNVHNLKIEFESAGTDVSQWNNSLPATLSNVIVAKTK